MVGALPIISVQVAGTLIWFPSLSWFVAVIVILYVPIAVGVPDNVPAIGSNVSPSGTLFATTPLLFTVVVVIVLVGVGEPTIPKSWWNGVFTTWVAGPPPGPSRALPNPGSWLVTQFATISTPPVSSIVNLAPVMLFSLMIVTPEVVVQPTKVWFSRIPEFRVISLPLG